MSGGHCDGRTRSGATGNYNEKQSVCIVIDLWLLKELDLVGGELDLVGGELELVGGELDQV